MGSLGHFRRGAVGVALALVLAGPSRAHAAGFELQTSSPTEAGDHFHLAPDGEVSGAHTFHARLFVSDAYKPLFRTSSPTGEHDAVTSQLYMNAGAAYALANVVLFALDLPFVPHQGTPDGTNSAGLGDLRLAVRGAMVRLPALSLGGEGRLYLPTGNSDALIGDGAVRGSVNVAASGSVSLFRYAVGVGYLARRQHALGTTIVGSGVPFALAAGVELLDHKLLVGPELQGLAITSSSVSFLGRHSTPVIGILSARYRIESVVLGVGFGPGLTTAPGVAPRVLLSVAWEPRGEPTPPEAPAEDWYATPSKNAPPPPPPAAAPPPPPPEATPAPAPAPEAVAPAAPAQAAPAEPAPPKEDDATRQKARELFQAGVIAYDKKHYTEALAAFQEAYALKPHPIVLLNLAQSELMSGKRADACAHFQSWKKDAENPAPAVLEQANQGIRQACH